MQCIENTISAFYTPKTISKCKYTQVNQICARVWIPFSGKENGYMLKEDGSPTQLDWPRKHFQEVLCFFHLHIFHLPIRFKVFTAYNDPLRVLPVSHGPSFCIKSGVGIPQYAFLHLKQSQ